MHKRYLNKKLAEIWSDQNKLRLWQLVELAALDAQASLGLIDEEVANKIREILTPIPIDLEWWETRDQEVGHDLNAFLDERRRHLPIELQPFWHTGGMTSYDTEEPAMAIMLAESVAMVREAMAELAKPVMNLARKYRYTPMMARTHGQEAEIQSFGRRWLGYLQILRLDSDVIQRAAEALQWSKLSGAIGNYGGLSPEIEEEALAVLNLRPYPGVTQIMPRELYAPLAQSLAQLVLSIEKIGLDIRLGGRSGRPIMQEPFGKKQKGSSAMPQKKNTIKTEQLEGMGRMALGYVQMLMMNIVTWEERAIEQSCVERVAWVDLFHVTLNSLKVLTGVLNGLAVYPDNMLREIVDSRDTYAASHAKELLKQWLVGIVPDADEAYRMVQLAAFNAFEVPQYAQLLREYPIQSEAEIVRRLEEVAAGRATAPMVGIKEIIARGVLRHSPQLAADDETVERWNTALKQVFADQSHRKEWEKVFDPTRAMRHEDFLYEQILGE